MPPTKDWSVKFGADAGPAFNVLWVHTSGAKDMAGIGLMYGINLNVINNPSGVFLEFGIGGLSGNYSVTEGFTKMEIKTQTINFEFLIGGMSSSLYYKTGIRLGVLTSAKARVGNMVSFEPLNMDALNTVQFGIPFEFGGIIAEKVNIGLGWHCGFISFFKKEYTDDVSITPMELYLKVGIRL